MLLLRQSTLLLRSVEAGFSRITGRKLHNPAILDFACGWGRLTRLMLWFSQPTKIFGVDAFDEALQLCTRNKVPGSFAKCNRVLDVLPFNGVQFDLIYGFSIFTHLSEEAMMEAQL